MFLTNFSLLTFVYILLHVCLSKLPNNTSHSGRGKKGKSECQIFILCINNSIAIYYLANFDFDCCEYYTENEIFFVPLRITTAANLIFFSRLLSRRILMSIITTISFWEGIPVLTKKKFIRWLWCTALQTVMMMTVMNVHTKHTSRPFKNHLDFKYNFKLPSYHSTWIGKGERSAWTGCCVQIRCIFEQRHIKRYYENSVGYFFLPLMECFCGRCLVGKIIKITSLRRVILGSYICATNNGSQKREKNISLVVIVSEVRPLLLMLSIIRHILYGEAHTTCIQLSVGHYFFLRQKFLRRR